MYDRGIPHKLKGIFYSSTIRPPLSYGMKCWDLKHCQILKMNVAVIHMLRWIIGCVAIQEKIAEEYDI